MTADPGKTACDVSALLDALWEIPGVDETELVARLHAYFIASARRISRLLPQEASRRGIDIAARYVAGEAAEDELTGYDYYSEGAAFNIDYNCDPASIARWVDELAAMNEDELASLYDQSHAAEPVGPREILKQAAYFANFAMNYPFISRPRKSWKRYVPFLSE